MKIRVEKVEIEFDLPNIVEQVINLEMSRDASEGGRVSTLMAMLTRLAEEVLKTMINPPKRPDIKFPDLKDTSRPENEDGEGGEGGGAPAAG